MPSLLSAQSKAFDLINPVSLFLFKPVTGTSPQGNNRSPSFTSYTLMWHTRCIPSVSNMILLQSLDPWDGLAAYISSILCYTQGLSSLLHSSLIWGSIIPSKWVYSTKPMMIFYKVCCHQICRTYCTLDLSSLESHCSCWKPVLITWKLLRYMMRVVSAVMFYSMQQGKMFFILGLVMILVQGKSCVLFLWILQVFFME